VSLDYVAEESWRGFLLLLFSRGYPACDLTKQWSQDTDILGTRLSPQYHKGREVSVSIQVDHICDIYMPMLFRIRTPYNGLSKFCRLPFDTSPSYPVPITPSMRKYYHKYRTKMPHPSFVYIAIEKGTHNQAKVSPYEQGNS